MARKRTAYDAEFAAHGSSIRKKLKEVQKEDHYYISEAPGRENMLDITSAERRNLGTIAADLAASAANLAAAFIANQPKAITSEDSAFQEDFFGEYGVELDFEHALSRRHRFPTEEVDEKDSDYYDYDHYEEGDGEYVRASRMVEKEPMPRKDFEIMPCDCNSASCTHPKDSGVSCCYVYGKACNEYCACMGKCDNIWNGETKERLFGKSDLEYMPNPCFVGWYTKLSPRTQRHTTLDILARLVATDLELADYADPDDCTDIDSWLFDDFLPRWQDVKDRPENDPLRRKLAQRLVRYAFTDDRELLGDTYDNFQNGCYYSFCQQHMSDDDITESRIGPSVRHSDFRHCWGCHKCAEKTVWHCSNCKKCVGDFKEPCDGCGGCGDGYHQYHLAKLEAKKGGDSEEFSGSPPSF